MEINTPVIPEVITVHLGAPGEKAKNITVPFTEYIKIQSISYKTKYS